MSHEKKTSVIMNFSGVYEEIQPETESSVWIDCKDLSGTNCYCDDEAAAYIKQKILPYKESRIHFIDSGNYHYMTRIWTDLIETDFDLIVFDNHTDMQPPAFGGLLSCGGWIASALQENSHLQNVVLIGPDENDYKAVDESLKQKVLFLSRQTLDVCRREKEDMKQVLEELLKKFSSAEKERIGEKGKQDLPEKTWMQKLSDNLSTEGRRPVYISIDKDILSPEEILTNWSQGDMTFVELQDMLSIILEWMKNEKRNLLGIDICGEAEPGHTESHEQSKRINETLAEICKALDIL